MFNQLHISKHTVQQFHVQNNNFIGGGGAYHTALCSRGQECKVTTLQVSTGPEVSRRLRLPDFDTQRR